MKYAFPLLLAAMLASAAPAMADNDHGRNGGGWHGGGGESRGESRGGNGEGRGGRWSGGQGQGQGQAGRGAPEGRWNGGYPGGEPGPAYAPPHGRVMSGPEPYREQDEARDGVRSGSIRSMGWVVGRLERSHAGRMLDAQLEQGPAGRPVYRVIWAGADGRRSDFIIDAQTGAILQGY